METLKTIDGWFSTGKTPTEDQYYRKNRSFWHKSEKFPTTQVLGLNDALNDKATKSDLQNLTNGLRNLGEVANLTELDTIVNPQDGDAYKVIGEKDPNGNSYIYRYTVRKDENGNVISQGWVNTKLIAFDGNIATIDNLNEKADKLDFASGFFDIPGFVEKGNGSIVYDESYLKASIFFKIKGSEDIIITGYSGLNDSAGLCGCYDKDKKFISSINAPLAGWVNEYTIPISSLPSNTYYVRFTRINTQPIYIRGVHLIMSDKDVQDFFKNDIISLDNDRTYINSGYFDIVGYINKNNGLRSIQDDFRCTRFLKVIQNADITISGYSGLNDAAGLCVCYNESCNYIGVVQSPTNGVIYNYTIPYTSLPKNTYYIRCTGTKPQYGRYVKGVETRGDFNTPLEQIDQLDRKLKSSIDNLNTSLIDNFFNIQGFVEKGNGKIILDSYLRASIYLKTIPNTDIIISGYSGLNDAAGLCGCYDKNKKFLGSIQAPINGVVNRYTIPYTSLLADTYYVRFTGTNVQEIYVSGIENIMSSKDIQQFYENDINVINNDRTYINSGYFDIVGYINKNNGFRSIQDDFRCTRFLKVISNADIVISGYSGLNDSAGLCVCYDENCNYISVVQSPTNGVVYDYTIPYSSLPANTYYIRCTGTKPQYNRYVKGVETRGDFNTHLEIVDKTKRTLDVKIQENSFYPDFVKIRNYIGHYQNIHPKVLYFENGLFGYKYWMGYTPFPYATEMYENPCIAVSLDGINWTVPVGLKNPLAYAPDNGYNSDTHLVYREDTNTLELWYRPYDKATSKGRLVRRTTTDGIYWTPEVIVSNVEGVLSPSIIFEDGKYKLWYPTNRKVIAYTESTDDTASKWTAPIETILPNITAWHMDVIKTNNGIEFLIQGWEDGGGDNNHSQLYYAIEKDGVLSKPVRIADKTLLPEPSENYRGLYRSSFVLINGVYSLYYSFIKKDWEQGMFLAQGADILHLNPYNREINRRNNILVIDQDTVMSDYYIHSANTIHIKDCIVTLESFTNAIPNSIITIVVSGDDGVCIINPSSRLIGQSKTITTNDSCRILAISANSGVIINQS